MSQNERPKLTGAQIRAARSLVRWSAADLAVRAELSLSTIQRAERSDGVPVMTAANMTAIRRAFEGAGVDLIPENGGGAGARLRRPQAATSDPEA